MLATLLASGANRALGDSAGFSDRAVQVVHTPAVETLIADTVTNRIVGYAGVGSSVQPIVADAVRVALANGQLTSAVRAAAASLQSQLVAGNSNSLTLTLADLGPSVAAAVASQSPQLAAAARQLGAITVVDVPIPPTASSAIHHLAVLGRDRWLLLVLSVALALLALIISPARGRTVIGLGLGAVVSGLLCVAAYLAGRELVVNQFSTPALRGAAAAAWRIYLGGVENSGLVLAGVGAGVAVIAALAVGTARTVRTA